MGKTIILNTSEIESVREREDACIVKMKSGKAWILLKEMEGADGQPVNVQSYILNNPHAFVKVVLSKKRED